MKIILAIEMVRRLKETALSRRNVTQSLRELPSPGQTLMQPKQSVIDYLRGNSGMSSHPPGCRFVVQSVLMLAVAAALCAAPAVAQYVGQAAKPENAPELRSVAVLEWIGDQAHPTRSRIIPITVFDGHELQDGGIYLAQPQPIALDHEVEYQLKQDGKNTGLFIVYGAAEENGSWVGYGKLQPMPKPKPPKPLNAHDWKEDDAASDEPVLHRKHGSGDSAPGSASTSSGSGNPAEAPDPDRPTLHKAPGASSDSGTDSGSNSGSQPATDPDRPTLHKSPDSDSSSTADSGSGSTDPDRPKLTKKKTSDNSDDDPSVSSVDTTDPNRPKLKRGQVSYGADEVGGAAPPTLKGLPPEMQQAVAVSDSKNTPEHPWDYSWANPDDQQKYKAQLEDLARTALGLTPAPAPSPKTKTAAKASTHKSTKAAAPAPAEPAPLEDEQFRVFELAYGSGATMVLSAHTAGTGAQEKFVTLVAQPDLYGNIGVLLKSTTDGSHLDDSPRMRLIDAVDAMADNRGELLFELRGQTQRQFALYRVLRGEATRLFVSGGSDTSEANN
jgi:hypothetical protein